MSLVNDAKAYALSGDTTVAESFTFGSATVVIGDAGTVIIVEAGENRRRSRTRRDQGLGMGDRGLVRSHPKSLD